MPENQRTNQCPAELPIQWDLQWVYHQSAPQEGIKLDIVLRSLMLKLVLYRCYYVNVLFIRQNAVMFDWPWPKKSNKNSHHFSKAVGSQAKEWQAASTRAAAVSASATWTSGAIDASWDTMGASTKRTSPLEKKQVVHCLLLPGRHCIYGSLCTRKKSLGMIPHWSLLSEALGDPDIHFCIHGTFGKNPSAPGSLLLFTTPWSNSWDAKDLVDLSRKLESIQAVMIMSFSHISSLPQVF